MVRAAVALVSTVIGLILLLGYKTAPTGHPRPVALAPRTPGPTHPRTPGPTHPQSPAATHPSARPNRDATRMVTGSTIQTPYGPVQVRIAVRNRHLTDVSPVQLPSDQAQSRAIASYAAPILRSEALTAGNAHINVVSGATYTSDGYAQSLQSAIDQAGLA